jgi:hypothetical protein
MALVFIKRKKEPVEISNERARRIKVLRFGDQFGENKAEPTELVDLGDEWAGEIGQIVSVEITKDRPHEKIVEDPDKEYRAFIESQLKLSLRDRASQLARFSMMWFARSSFSEKEPPQEVKDMAREAGLKWLTANPNEPLVHIKVYEPILVKYWGEKKHENARAALADKMGLSPEA